MRRILIERARQKAAIKRGSGMERVDLEKVAIAADANSDTLLFVNEAIEKFAAAIHVWDLRAIRTGLKPMGLDWDWPEFPKTNAAPQHVPPLRIELITGVVP